MIISDTFGFVFVHVPKSAGSTVREQLMSLDPEATSLWGRTIHPTLGEIDLAHLPLAALRDHYPDHYRRLRALESFALIRDPRERFESSLAQHVKAAHGTTIHDLGSARVEELVDEVLLVLESDVDVLPAAYIHFARQATFVKLDEKPVVTAFAVERLGEMFDRLSSLTGRTFDADARANQSFRLGSGGLDRLARFLNRQLWRGLSPSAYRALRRGLAPVVEGRLAHRASAAIALSPDVRRRVEAYYAADLALYEELCSAT